MSRGPDDGEFDPPLDNIDSKRWGTACNVANKPG